MGLVVVVVVVLLLQLLMGEQLMWMVVAGRTGGGVEQAGAFHGGAGGSGRGHFEQVLKVSLFGGTGLRVGVWVRRAFVRMVLAVGCCIYLVISRYIIIIISRWFGLGFPPPKRKIIA